MWPWQCLPLQLASSPMNSTVGREVCIVRIQEIPEPLYPPTLEKSKVVKTLVYKIKGSAVLDYSDKLADYSEHVTTLLSDKLATYHASVLVTLHGYCTDTSLHKMESGFVGFTECVKDLAYALRLFTFGP